MTAISKRRNQLDSIQEEAASQKRHSESRQDTTDVLTRYATLAYIKLFLSHLIRKGKATLAYKQLNKASGINDIPAELLQRRRNYVPNLLHHPILKIYTKKKLSRHKKKLSGHKKAIKYQYFFCKKWSALDPICIYNILKKCQKSSTDYFSVVMHGLNVSLRESIEGTTLIRSLQMFLAGGRGQKIKLT